MYSYEALYKFHPLLFTLLRGIQDNNVYLYLTFTFISLFQLKIGLTDPADDRRAATIGR